ncbi:hypothetical protein GX50_03652 [[Emmonsia] crescens]|uniref:Uncharacterized protein n=1 Tax=[Emmonsia] crescens TaxID=73230 RepID=A0A2B7ZHQ0_9EURO|nr:hypothetical protein GX50_03652 [Emmonsia crescens]
MASQTLFQYLTAPNPKLDNQNAPEGRPTFQEIKSDIIIQPWSEFKLDTLLACHSHALQKTRTSLHDCSPPLTKLELEIWNEDTFEHVMTRSIVPQVNVSLDIALSEMEVSNVINMTRGGRANAGLSQPLDESDGGEEKEKGFPDWAGAIKVGDQTGYVNRCPGDTKLSGKWMSIMSQDDDFYYWPIAQVLKYCSEIWGTRYGYLINQYEVVVMRFSRERIGSGIALTRPVRGALPKQGPPLSGSHRRNDSRMSASSQMQIDDRSPQHSHQSSQQGPSHSQSHHRNLSLASATSHMAIDDRSSGRSHQSSPSSGARDGSPSTTSSYHDTSRNLECQLVEMMSIPWENHGPGKLTVKLALWWIHMLAGADCDIYIDHEYPSLHSWRPVEGGYRHTSTGKMIMTKPTNGKILDNQSPQRPTTPQNQGGSISSLSSPLSSAPSHLGSSPSRAIASQVQQVSPSRGGQLTVEAITSLKFDKSNGMFIYTTKGSSEKQYMNPRSQIWGVESRVYYYPAVQNGHARLCPVSSEPRSSSSSSASGRESERSSGRGGKQRK